MKAPGRVVDSTSKLLARSAHVRQFLTKMMEKPEQGLDFYQEIDLLGER